MNSPFDIDHTRSRPILAGSITVAMELPGRKVVRNIGVCRGIVVRSRSIVGNIIGAVHSLFGGNITVYTELCEQARKEAFELMVQEAHMYGANAIIGVRYDATEVMPGLTEVLCYGSAVLVEDLAP